MIAIISKTPFINPQTPAVVVAPMEGVTDAPMRALLTEVGGFSYCVSEFFRISQDVPQPRAFLRHIPELAHGALTPSGVSVQVQILGGDPEKMALSAINAVAAGAQAIDINFGCPAPTVNRNDGGATLLKYPHRIRSIVEAVRTAVAVPVSAKLRLGWDDICDIHRNAEAAAEGGAAWLTIHGRTKAQGYRPPAHWEPIGEIRARLKLPIIANGDIWTLDDFRRCRDVTACSHFMLGRSALGNPWLARAISAELGLPVAPLAEITVDNWLDILHRFTEFAMPYSSNSNYVLCRMKQWLRMTPHKSSAINTATSVTEIYTALRNIIPPVAQRLVTVQQQSRSDWSQPRLPPPHQLASGQASAGLASQSLPYPSSL